MIKKVNPKAKDGKETIWACKGWTGDEVIYVEAKSRTQALKRLWKYLDKDVVHKSGE